MRGGRQKLYAQGGLYSITSRILVVDMLTSKYGSCFLCCCAILLTLGRLDSGGYDHWHGGATCRQVETLKPFLQYSIMRTYMKYL